MRNDAHTAKAAPLSSVDQQTGHNNMLWALAPKHLCGRRTAKNQSSHLVNHDLSYTMVQKVRFKYQVKRRLEEESRKIVFNGWTIIKPNIYNRLMFQLKFAIQASIFFACQYMGKSFTLVIELNCVS